MKRERAGSIADGILLVCAAGLTFLLACQEMFDADIWWHLRAGRWILEHREFPRVDTFTFGSAGRPWIDLHWIFQLAAVLVYEAGGVRGIILLAATGVTTAVVAGLFSRRRVWPAWIVALAWLPGILLASCRFDPRPELVTLISITSFLGILTHARHRPEWLWLLVPIQILWVNSHGLFVIGPAILGLFLFDRAVMPTGLPPWRRLVPPSVIALLACLLNPYGVNGLLFPLELYPKLTESGGAYKAYIAEFMSARMRVESFWAPWGHDLYLRLFVFLLVALPLVVLLPSLWRAWTAARPENASPARVDVWVGGMAVSLGLALAVAAGIPVQTTPAWRAGLGRAAPWLLAMGGLVTAVILGRRSRLAAALAAAGFGATSAWIIWLTCYLFPSESTWMPGAMALGLGLVAGLLALRAGTRPFGPMLAATFAYLGLLAIRNMNLFGLVAGAVLAAELGEWAAELARGGTAKRVGTAARLAVLGVVGLLAAAVVTGRFFSAVEDCHRFGLRERPFYYAHDACRFASRPGLPDRALAFGLTQAAVYDFHNAPARRVFMDGRLEVASRATFETYARLHVWLSQGDPRWKDVARRLGNPLMLVDHTDQATAEATLFADPEWRCVFHDGVAAVFLPWGQTEGDRALERAYPTIDFAAKHFARLVGPASSPGPGSALAEAQALLQVHSIFAYRAVAPWSLRIPIGLVAMDRAREALAQTTEAADVWVALGNSALALVPDRDPIAGPGAPWDPAAGLPWAQATYAYREALQKDPAKELVAPSLAATFAMRGMDDARVALENRSAGGGAVASQSALPPLPADESLASRLEDLLQRGRPAAAVSLAAEARSRGRVLPWVIADRIACTQLHLGDPTSARRIWREAVDPPSQAILAARVGDAAFAAWDLEGAAAGYRRALSLDSNFAEAWVGLALIGLERGDAGKALVAARAALKLKPSPNRTWLLEGILALCEPYAR
jgi:tetratricopeptide (TPR) repeat protein